ncbi:hypothetical protein [Lutibacter oceani]|nr:hypothetical protein [Lutibacter oceani]
MNKKIDLEKNDKITVLQKYKAKKYFILHDQQSDTHLYNVILDEFNKKIKAQTSEIDDLHTFYKPVAGEKSHSYKKKLGDPKSEIHLYSSSPIYTDAKNIVDIPLDKIDSIIVHESDTGHEVLKVVGITAGTLVVVTALVAALKSSCPFVYSNDGTLFTFEGELYPGAIRPSMERNDYFQLKHIKGKENSYRIKVSNELKEIQYTNSLNLIEVLHPENSEAMIDQNGKIHTIKNPISPFEMIVGNQPSNPEIVEDSDNNSFHFNAITDSFEFQTLKLKFNRPQEKDKVKLVLRLKNSYWLDYTFGKFYKKFGSSFNEFQKKNRNQPYEKSLKWMKEQGIPLEILIRNNEEWTLVESLNMVGPLAFRDIVVPIDLKSNSFKPLEIMLRCGFMFWEVDKVAADFSENLPVIVNNLKPFRAIDQDGNDVLKFLTEKDDQYLVQPNIGDQVYVSFKNNSEDLKDGKKTIFLENRGYYEYIRNFSGTSNKLELMTFRNPGTFTKFSEKMYYDFISGEQALEELAIFDIAK